VGSLLGCPCQQFFNSRLQNNQLGTLRQGNSNDHRLLWRDSYKVVDRALTSEETILHKISNIIIDTKIFKLSVGYKEKSFWPSVDYYHWKGPYNKNILVYIFPKLKAVALDFFTKHLHNFIAGTNQISTTA